MTKFNKKYLSILFAAILLGIMCFFPIWKIQVKSEIFNHTEYYSVITLLFNGFKASKNVDNVRFIFEISPINILFFLTTTVVGFKFICSHKRFNIGIILMCIGILSVFVFDNIRGKIDSQEVFSVGYSQYTGMNFYFLIPLFLLITLCIITNYFTKNDQKDKSTTLVAESVIQL